MDKKAFGSRLRQARKDRGLTSEKLSELCNINATYADGNTVSDEDHYRHVDQRTQGASGELD